MLIPALPAVGGARGRYEGLDVAVLGVGALEPLERPLLGFVLAGNLQAEGLGVGAQGGLRAGVVLGVWGAVEERGLVPRESRMDDPLAELSRLPEALRAGDVPGARGGGHGRVVLAVRGVVVHLLREDVALEVVGEADEEG